MLSIKPVMHVDDEGHLTKVGTARGRNASLKALVDHMAETAIDPAGQTVFISHGDCEGDANRVAEDVKRRFQSRFADVLRILPYCDEARFFDNDNGFVEVAEYRNGELIPRVPTPPHWLLELMERV